MSYNKIRPIGHQDDDDEMPFWRYDVDCGCWMCLEYEAEMMDIGEADQWDNTDYPLGLFDEEYHG